VKQLTLYTRVGCHLCDVMKAQIERIGATHAFALEVVDVDEDPALQRLYDHEVPVLMVDGTKIAKYRLDEPMLLRRLQESA